MRTIKVKTAEKESDGPFRAWTIGAMVLILAVAVLLSSCGEEAAGGDQGGQQGGEETVPRGEEAETAGQAIGVSVSDITDNPSEFYGKKATVSGLVTQTVGPNAFVIGGGEFFGESGLLIVGSKKLTQIVEGAPEGGVVEIQQQDLAQATGTVKQFNLQEFENQLGYELEDGLFDDFADRPAVIADQVVLTPRQGETTMQAQQGVPVELSNLVDEPAEFFGQQATVRAPIARVISPNAFVVVPQETVQQQGQGFFDDPQALAENGLLVVSGQGTGANLTENQTVQVTGQVQQADISQFEQELGVGFENNEFLSAFEEGQRPAIVASQVQQQ